jgi:hypothetical protein
MATPELAELHRKADEAWIAYSVDLERQKADREALERLMPAVAELRERFGFPGLSHDQIRAESRPMPEVYRNVKLRTDAMFAVFQVFDAGGTWTPPGQH